MKPPNYWIVSILLALLLWLGFSHPSYADILLSQSPVTHQSEITADPKLLHVLNRLSFGPRPGDIKRLQSTGIDAYIQSQLQPETIPYPAELRRNLAKLDTLEMSPVELLKKPTLDRQARPMSPQEASRNARMWNRKVFEHSAEARLRKAIASPRQLEEVMVDFWFNHFNVFADRGLSSLIVGTYERDAIRPYILSNFRDLLGATAHHPAMLFYLDNWLNSAPNNRPRGRFRGINENYARELMELHTLGVDGGYTQEDVIALARIFTGWGVSRAAENSPDMSGFHFDANRHDFSDKLFLGNPIKGSGMDEGEQALDILARHPSTARHISYKLAQYFVADEPPARLVNRLTQKFRQSDGNIRDVLQLLFQSPEFWNPNYYGAKFKTPYQYIISAVRATGTENPDIKAVFGALKQLEMPLYGCRTPNGYQNTQDSWLNPNAMLRRVSMATILAQGRWIGGQPVNPNQLANTLGNNFSPNTQEVIKTSPVRLRAGLILGSPEMMKR